MSERLCPSCGAYWQCDCLQKDLPGVSGSAPGPPAGDACPHDWVPTVGVEHEEALPENAAVVVCRLCGLYAVGAIRQ